MELIDLNRQQTQIIQGLEKRIKQVLKHGHYVLGPEVNEIEDKLAEYVGVKHCISCANGTDALQLALMALEVGPGDLVFTTNFSFFATAESIALVGATPVFCDIDPATYNISPKSLESVIQSAIKLGKGTPKAIIAVDLFGLPANYPELMLICSKYNLLLIEDAAQGFGGSIGGNRAGSFADIATTSFFPAKPLGCYGDGGALLTDSDELNELCRSLRVHGKGENKYDNVRIGLNSRLDTIQAAVLIEKLTIFDYELELRNKVAEIYQRRLHGTGYQFVKVAGNMQSSWAQFTLQHASMNREKVMQALKGENIPTAIYYPKVLSHSPAFIDIDAIETPNAINASKAVFSIPMHPYLKTDEQQKILDTLLELEQQYRV